MRRCPIRNPEADLRTADLKPLLEEWPSFEALVAAVAVLAERRRALLGPRSNAGDPGGRILISEFNLSITSGESEEETHGFFDISDRPPWDTWLFCLQRRDVTHDSLIDLLVSWVPSALVDSVDRGIRVNPYDCIYWASGTDLSEWGLSD